MRKILSIGLIALLGTGCTHSIHQVYISDYSPYIDKKAGEQIQVRTEQDVVMGFVGDSQYVEQAYAQLQRKCRGGSITGITTQYSTSHGFFSWKNRLLLKGRCHR